MVTIDREPIAEKEKKPNAFKNIMHLIFVKNIGYKLLSLALSITLWIITVGL